MTENGFICQHPKEALGSYVDISQTYDFVQARL